MVLVIKHPAAENAANQFNSLKRYVRVRGVINDKFVEFDFAIGDPSLYVELVLPKAAFHAFCEHNQVEMMTSEQSDAVDADMEKWRYGDSDSLR
jgi:phenol/toluene 2-monooxygenase (NADH) P0/A0